MADPIFKELAYAALAQTARNPTQDFLRATPRNPVLGYLADLAASSYAPQRTQQMQGIAQFFGAPAVSQTLDRLSYGEPLTTGAGGLGGTTRIRPEAIEAAMIAAPFAGKAAKATKGLPVGMSIKDVSAPQDLLTSINPTGSVFTKYTPELRASQPLAKNITTLDKTTGLNPDELITIYRGAPSNQKKIAPGDFITDNPQLAKDYAGSGKVLQMKVRRGDVLDDLDDPLGGEYIYRPNATLNLSVSPPQAEAMRLAQQRAALPVEQGGLGLPANNTAAERAAAMGFDTPAFHGTNKSFDAFKVGKGGVDELGAGAYTTEAPYAANMWATGEGGNVMPMMVKSKDVFDRSNINKDSYLDIAARIKQNPESLPPLVRSWADESVEDLATYIEQTSKQGGLNAWLQRAQYIGAKDQGSQIPLQQVTFNPENIRSRFAAFDPFRKTAATAATMGVAAPDLLAQEQPSEMQLQAMILRDMGTDPYTIYQQTGVWLGGNE